MSAPSFVTVASNSMLSRSFSISLDYLAEKTVARQGSKIAHAEILAHGLSCVCKRRPHSQVDIAFPMFGVAENRDVFP